MQSYTIVAPGTLFTTPMQQYATNNTNAWVFPLPSISGTFLGLGGVLAALRQLNDALAAAA